MQSKLDLGRYRLLSILFALLAFCIGGAAFAGWVFNVDLLKRVHPSLVTMKANTALCLMLVAVSVLLLQALNPSPVKRRIAQVCAVIVGAIGLLTLSEHLFGWNLGIDQLLFAESIDEAGQSFPGRMGVAASLNFSLLGATLLLMDTRWVRLFNLAILMVVTITVLVFLYYFYGIDIEPVALYFTIALHTVVAFLSLCASILLARPDRGVVATLLSNTPGGVLARRTWPVLLIVILLGWIRTISRDAGWVGPGFGTAAFVLIILLILVALTWRTAVSLNRADRERRLADSAMRESEARLTALLDQLPVGIGLTDREGRFLTRNSLLDNFAGEKLPFVDPLFRDRWRAWDSEGRLMDPADWPSARALRGEVVSPGWEMLYCSPEGKETWTRVACVPFRDRTDELAGVIVVVQDIDEQRRAEKRLLQSEQEARDAAERTNQLKDEFLATLSHELRNPLNVILGYSELLLRMPEIDHSSRLRQMGEALKRNAQSQSQLINDLLDLSRLQRRKIVLNREKISLAAVIDAAVETVRAEASAKGIDIRLQGEDELLLVEGDRLRLQQIAWNVLNNAVKFTPAGGSIHIHLSRDAENAALVIEDTGQGIDPSFLPHVFEMFRQADASNSRRHGGLGIGLALVRQLVQLHGGAIAAESEGVDKGSRFTVKLPLAKETESQSQALVTASAPLPLNGLAHTNFLILDDSEDTIAMLDQLLTIGGANVTKANNGAEALRLAGEQEFDVILSDISMPEMDGFQFLERLRKIDGRQRVPVIAITGFGRAEDIERVRAAGFYSHLTKPLNLDALAEMLQQLANEKRLN